MEHPERPHISDLPFYHFLTLHHRLGPKLHTRHLTRKARAAYHKYSDLVPLLESEESYSHTVEQLYSRVVEKHNQGGPGAPRISFLLDPLVFLKALLECIEAGCISITLAKFSLPRQIEQEFLGSVSHPKEKRCS